MLNILKSMKRIGNLMFISFTVTAISLIFAAEKIISENFWDTIGTIAMVVFFAVSAYAIVKFIILCIIAFKNNIGRRKLEQDPNLRDARRFTCDKNYDLYISQSGYIGFSQNYKLSYLTHINNITSYGIVSENTEILCNGNINSLMNTLSAITNNQNFTRSLYILFNTNDFHNPTIMVPFITQKTKIECFDLYKKNHLIEIFRTMNFLDNSFGINRTQKINLSKS